MKVLLLKILIIYNITQLHMQNMKFFTSNNKVALNNFQIIYQRKILLCLKDVCLLATAVHMPSSIFMGIYTVT